MNEYKITINISNPTMTYSNVKDMEEAKKIANSLRREIYLQLGGRCTVEVESIEGRCF